MSAGSWLAEPWVHRLGWTLIQFLWQGAVIAGIFAVVRATIGRSLSSRGRYGLACATLVVMTLAPILTFAAGAGVAGGASTRWLAPATTNWDSFMPMLVALWSLGVLLCSLRLIGGWLAARRLRAVGVRPAPAEWQETFAQLVQRFDIAHRVRLLVSSRVDVPVVVGWLRPLVLVPVGALTGLPAEYVTALLAHELAHVARRDYLVNLLQRVAESLLFYHPAVWWVSGQIRVEREMCCDELAVAAQGDRVVYACALAELESVRQSHGVALAANGPSLLHRIHRLFGHPSSGWQLLPGPAAIVAMAVVCGIGMAGVAARDQAVERPMADPTLNAAAAAPRPSLLTTAILGPIGPAPGRQTPATPSQSARPGMPPATVIDPATPGTVRGRVLSAETGLPIARAVVEIFPDKPGPNDPPWGTSATTDSAGRYELRDLPPRRYTLRAMRRGFAMQTYGSKGTTGRPRLLEVGPGSRTDLADLALPSGGVISGTVVDQAGDPLGGIVIQALRPTDWDSSRPGAEASSDVTDDRGLFRIYGLAAGTYYLRALRTPVGRYEPTGYAPLALVYYPGTIRPTQAQAVVVENGIEAAASFAFALGTRVGVSGAVTAAAGNAATGTVSLRPHFVDNTRRILESSISGGAFDFGLVPPGEYIVTARNATGTEMVTKRVVVEDGAERVSLVLQKTASIHGRVVLDTREAAHGLRPADIQMAWFQEGFAPRTSGVTIRPDWSFEVTGLVGTQEFGYTPPRGWALKEIRHGKQIATKGAINLRGEDIDDVEVVFTDRVTRVSGRVSDGLNRPATGVVIVFAEDRALWRSGVRHSDAADIDDKGAYSVSALPPGRYLAVAVADAEELTPATLERLRRRATALTLRDGEGVTLNLTRSTP